MHRSVRRSMRRTVRRSMRRTVRVIAGSARGRILKSPPRPKPNASHHRARRPLPAIIRPTSDLVRGVIFDMLDAMGADYTRVLDLYAGSGALGIEALSRGDGDADFVDIDGSAIATIHANLALTGFAPRAGVHRIDASAAAARLAGRHTGPYTLVLADPPYDDPTAPRIVADVASSSLVDDGTVFVLEHHRRVPPPPALGPLPLYRTRRHGDTVVSIYAHAEDR
jgi:16S rRNA (guanine966-N2)-methyltransferase